MNPLAPVAIAFALFTLAALYAALTATRRLNALRSNCYLTDADGVRRRYGSVRPEVRDRAER